MRVIEKGHIYVLANKGAADKEPQELVFCNKEPGHEHPGTTTQEVIRALIDRTRHCNNCLPHPNNARIIYHLRMAIGLHEARAIERMIEKGELTPEYVDIAENGHFHYTESKPKGPITPDLVPYVQDWDKTYAYDLNNDPSDKKVT